MVRRVDSGEEVVLKQTNVLLQAGDTVSFLTAGGGGYGAPGDRDREAVLRDVALGYVSPEAAAALYGVFVSEAVAE